MSQRELGRVEVLARVRSQQLRVVEAVPGTRGCGSEAWQRRTDLESCSRREVSAEGAASGAGEVRWARGRAFRSDAGGGALGLGGWTADGCRNAAALDVGGGVVEPRAEAAGTPSSAGAQGTLWRDGADGWQVSRLARALRRAAGAVRGLEEPV